MENLPEDVMIEKILLKLPANTLCNLRYVSNYLWSLITNPNFVKLHLHHSIAQINNHLLLISCRRRSFRQYKNGTIGPKHLIHNYACNLFTTTSNSSGCPEIVEIHCPFESTEIRASCNGLLYLHRRLMDDEGKYVGILNYIWNPCTKEYKELPPPPPPLLLQLDDDNNNKDLCYRTCSYTSGSGFCGFGYDRTKDEYKILHYENLVDPTYIIHDGFFEEAINVSSTVEFKLYTLGRKNNDNTWTSIVDNPYKSFFFSESCRRIGLLVNGALHWIMCLSDPASKGKIVSFDIGKEVFREVQKPHYYFMEKEEEEEDQQNYYESLQVLQECLCICQVHPNSEVRKINIWMLRDYDVTDSWTKLFRVVIPNEDFSSIYFKLLGYSENGEILMLRNKEDVIMYDPLNHKTTRATKFNESIEKLWLYYMDYTESLASLNSGTYTSS